MASLADAGYLSQPHTSAGRLPTEKAFRDYVQSLNAGRMASADAARLRIELMEAPTAARARRALLPYPDRIDAQCGHHRISAARGVRTGPDRTGAAGAIAKFW